MDTAVIDLSDTFEYGQGYVALSRLRTLAGLHLLGFNQKTFQVHGDVLEQDIIFKRHSIEAEDAFAKLDPEEIERMHTNFLKSIGATGVHKKEKKLSTLDETLLFVQDGKSIEEIATEKGIKIETVYDHIYKLAQTHRLSKSAIARIINDLDDSDIQTIAAVFRKLGIERLTPVFENFKGEYSFEQLKLVRAYCVAGE
jgi:hypothetical protein